MVKIHCLIISSSESRTKRFQPSIHAILYSRMFSVLPYCFIHYKNEGIVNDYRQKHIEFI